MKTSRRKFIQSASAAAVLATLPGSVLAQATAGKPLDILILGGTGFIGPHEINYARARGHKITMFNRGKTAPGMFPDVETLIGDRDNQLDALKGRNWDAVIDNSGFFPRHVRLSAELLHGHVDQYMFVSSISAYGEDLAVEDDEFSAPYAVMDDPTDESEHVYGPSYGARKALCEQEVTKVFGEKAVNVRPGIITGVGDPTERLRHWLRRMQAGNEILVPGQDDLPVQYIDAADMCGWMVRLLEGGSGSGPYNAVGAEEPYRARPLLEGLRDATGSKSKLTWIDWEWIRNQTSEDPNYGPWYGAGPLPFMQVNNGRAMATGLTFRPIADTAKDMIANLDRVPIPERRRSGFGLETEALLLKKWHEEKG
ncbi:MAG: NAD-dependent epimerase/dehydratase family protein [Gammaproteobacteria bacterium]|nr:NAD-dependent epimerase/dehydratase family protein [Gammaproteobacteria bacterium]MBT8109225.1 NAD-dependent epimerase/dehydratase family protein [Gammaproteobacteria bacterium]NND46213.1 NAD-dependent epimerase/dehydratase family protein [Woeseiaceae bacterium]NNL43927.1 NAD-dependent epimerase/dehydratase family protein [Woeseiaceae bacterium]